MDIGVKLKVLNFIFQNIGDFIITLNDVLQYTRIRNNLLLFIKNYFSENIETDIKYKFS